VLDTVDTEVVKRVRSSLTTMFKSYISIAQSLDIVPWAALVACNQLVRSGAAIAGEGIKNGEFKTFE